MGRADPEVLLGLVIGRSTDPVRRTYSLIHQVSHHALGGVPEMVAVVEPDARVVRNERNVIGLAFEHVQRVDPPRAAGSGDAIAESTTA